MLSVNLRTVSALSLSVAFSVSSGSAVSSPSLEEITTRLVQAENYKRQNLGEYTVFRRYVLRNSHLDHDAVMLVKVIYRKGRGKTFEILEDGDAQGICRRVLERLLDAERQASLPGATDNASLTPDNYNFDYLGEEMQDGRRCLALAIHPKTRNKYVLEGKAWLDAEAFAPVRIEGRPASSIGFWVGKPYIIQRFENHDGFWLESTSRSRAESRLLGTTELTIECARYSLGS